MLAEVEAGGEPRAGAGQHDGGLRVVAFEPVECLVQVGEEGAVLRVTGLVVIVTTATRPRRSIVQLMLVPPRFPVRAGARAPAAGRPGRAGACA
jgi:hypothetical protein